MRRSSGSSGSPSSSSPRVSRAESDHPPRQLSFRVEEAEAGRTELDDLTHEDLGHAAEDSDHLRGDGLVEDRVCELGVGRPVNWRKGREGKW